MSHAELSAAVRALHAGDVVVYPTETVYGLGADARSARAIEALLTLKGRGATKGISVLVADLDSARALLATEPPAEARALAAAFWPGALTIVLPAAAGVVPALCGPGGGVGLRCSSDPVARELLATFGDPITSTSANPSGAAPAVSVDQAKSYFGGRVAVYVDGGTRDGTSISTVVEFSQGRAYLKRAGIIDIDALRAVTEIDTRRV